MYTEITKLIDNKNIVSFDIFDTLLFRNVAKPIDVFRIIDSIVKTKYNINNFTEKRIEAESNARKVVEKGEANYDEIYAQLEKNIKDKRIINEIKKLEMQKEEEFIVQNPFMKRVFDYCVEKNKKIYLISDMYFETPFINRLLKKCGYGDNCKIYVSCEYRKNKGTSELFKLVKEKEKLKYEEWIHMGDNYNSDYNVPKKLGMDAFHYRNVDSYEDVEYNNIFESIVLGVRNNFLYNGNKIDYWEKFGIKYLTPLYVGFTNWIFQMTYNCDNIFFLARDGYIIEKIFKLFPTKKYTKYLYCSRNSVQVPVALSGSSKDIINVILGSASGVTTLKKIFDICKLKTKKEYENIIKLYGFNSFEDEVDKSKRYDVLKCILAVLDDAKSEILKERDIVEKYLIQEGLNEFKRINIVDIGWGGSTQRYIEKALNKEVRGFYFGTINIGDDDFNKQSFGYMFDQDNDIYDKSRIFSQVMMYELAFSAPEGSVKKYEEKDGKIVPVFKEKDGYSEIVETFQNASLKVIKEIMKYYEYYDNIDKHFCLNFYQKYLEQYNWEDLMKFSSIENDYLIGNDKKFPYVQKLTKEYILNNFEKLDKVTDNSLWKGAFLIEGCSSEEEHHEFLNEVMKKYYPENYPSKSREVFRNVVPLKIRKALKNK